MKFKHQSHQDRFFVPNTLTITNLDLIPTDSLTVHKDGMYASVYMGELTFANGSTSELRLYVGLLDSDNLDNAKKWLDELKEELA